ncbi:alpha/beta fold hydrolase [Actinomadura sediminis]|uniref:Alpha/beta hydrolase n=1 Tax=Actinomadura sediminis TaxID=1038904 RepID=A0ABW3EF78_9ACTN
MTVTRTILTGLALLGAVATGCTAEPAVEPVARPMEEAPVPRTPAQPLRTERVDAPECFAGHGASAYRLPGTGDARLVTLGRGRTGVVFAPISWGDACEWAPEAVRLARAGHRVVTFDWGPDRRETVSAATRLLREQGAAETAWVGGCMGGNVMLGMAADARPAGVAAASPLPSLGGLGDGRDGYRGEIFVLGTTDDPLVAESELREAAGRYDGAELTVLPGTEHAAEMFTGPRAADARRALDAFLARTFAS